MKLAVAFAVVSLAACSENIPPVAPFTPHVPTDTVPEPGVRRAQPATLKFTQQPRSGVVGKVLHVVEVTVLDTLGNPDPVTGLPVTLTLKPIRDGVLTGTTTVYTTSGVARFTDLVINEPSQTWSLIAQTPGRPWVRCFWFPVTLDEP